MGSLIKCFFVFILFILSSCGNNPVETYPSSDYMEDALAIAYREVYRISEGDIINIDTISSILSDACVNIDTKYYNNFMFSEEVVSDSILLSYDDPSGKWHVIVIPRNELNQHSSSYDNLLTSGVSEVVEHRVEKSSLSIISTGKSFKEWVEDNSQNTEN